MMVAAKIDSFTTHHYLCTIDSTSNDNDLGTHCDNCYFYFSDNDDLIKPQSISYLKLIKSDLTLLAHHELTDQDVSNISTRDPPLLGK
tara:strand:+ start:196 stop:459 length:264 start_codon:yes stop_codon:yes gene_type:complete